MARVRADLAVGVSIARAELRDLLRRNDSRRQRATLALLALLGIPLWLSFVRQGYVVGVETRSGTSAEVVPVARNLLVPGLLVVALFGGLGAAQSLARNAVRPLVLTTASTRAIVVGKVLYLLSTWLLVLTLAAGPAFAYALGARAPVFVLALLVGGLPLLLLTMGIGLSLAYLLWVTVERLGLPEVARRLVTASLSVVAFLAAFVLGISLGQTTGQGVDAGLPTGDPLIPLGWYADLLFVGSPVAEPLGVRTALSAVVVWAALPVTFAVLVRLAPAYWYATPTDGSADERGDPGAVPEFASSPSGRIGRGEGLLGRFRTLRVALAYARNAARRPDQYVYLFYYLFPVTMVLVPLAASSPETAPAAAGVSLLLLGVWLAGSVVCLNPLGTEGAMLSQLVLAKTPARTFVHARLLVGVAIGATLSVLGVGVVVAWGAGVPPLTPASLWVALLVTGNLAAVLLTSGSFALGIGSVLPKFETTEVFDSLETLVPSVFAAVIHGLVSLMVLSGGVAATLALAPGNPFEVPRGAAVLGVGLFALALVALADGSRRYAIARFREYGRQDIGLGRPFAVYAAFALSFVSLILGQSISLGTVALLGPENIGPGVEVLLPILFVVEYMGAVIVAVGFLYVTRRGLAYLDPTWPSLRELGAVVAGLAALLVLWLLSAAVIAGLGLPSAENALFDPEDGDPVLLLVLVPLVLLVNGPVEELLYRNVIQKYLAERFSTAAAVAVASVVFTLAHIPAYLTGASGVLGIAVTLGLLFGLSCVLGALYAWTRNLVVVAAVHGLYNATLLVVTYLTVT
jgi:membrane protease YdiL (CAAX protease family)